MENQELDYGYGVNDAKGKFLLMEFNRRLLNPDDVKIQILYTGVCHSDWHHIHNDWKDSKYPMIPGHEIVGRVINVGANVTKFQVDQNVAVGTIVDSCGHCKNCHKSWEQYCLNNATETYNGKERLPTDLTLPTGPITMGGFSTTIVVKEHFVFDISMFTELERVAPLLCAGITVYNPLKQYKAGIGHKIGVAGIGGLGHMAVKIASKLGAEVIALTRTEWKLQDSVDNLGATDAILTTSEADRKRYEGKLDLIIDTIPTKHDLEPYFKLLKTDGTLWIVGAMEPLTANGATMSWNNLALKSSQVGGVEETQEFINFCYFHNILPDIELIAMSGVPDTYAGLKDSHVRYRYVIETPTILDL